MEGRQVKPFLSGILIVLVQAMPVLAGGLNVVGGHCYGTANYKQNYNQGYAQNVVHHYYHGYMVGQPLRDDAAAEKLADKLLPVYEKKLDAIMSDFKADLQGKLTLEFGAKASSSGNGSVGTSVTSGGDLSGVQAIFDANCVSCHAGASAKKGLDLTDATKLSTAMLMKCALKVHRGSMPPAPAEPLPQDTSDYLLKVAEELPAK